MKLIKKFKFINTILMVVIITEVIFISYHLINKKEKYIYFDGINAITSNDNYYVGVGSNNDNDMHFEKAKVSIYNTKKDKVNDIIYNIGYNSSFFGVVLDNNDIVAVGSYEEDISDREDSVRKALIVKYDKSGKILFQKDFELLNNSRFTSIVKYKDYYYVTGQSVYKSTELGNKSGGAILCKYNKNGKLIWSKSYGSNKSAIYNELLVYNNNLYVVGSDEGYLGIICKYDLDGNIIRYDNYKSTDDIGFSGIINIGSNIYVSGSNRSGDNNTAMIAMYDDNCNYIKENVYKTDKTSRYNKLVVDDNNDIIVIGTIYMENVVNHNIINDYNYDGMIGKYSSDLEKIDAVKYGDERDDYFTDIIFSNNKYIVAGYSSYEDGSYMSKFINYSKALKVLEVE